MNVRQLKGILLPEVCVVLLALGLRLWFLAGFIYSPLFTPVEGGHDRTLYHQAAQAVAKGNIWPAGSFSYLPLYPWTLGAVYAITGSDLRAAAGFGIACDALAVLLLMRLARRLGASTPWAALAGLLYAFYPRAIAYSALTMPTSLNVALVTALGFVLAQRTSSRSKAGEACRGTLAGVAGLGFPAIWPGVIALLLIRRSRWVFLVFALLPTLPVAIHNTRAEKKLTLLSTHGGFNFYMGNFEYATGYPLRIRDFRMSATAMQEDAHRAAEDAVGRPLSRAESSAWWSSEARHFMQNNPMQAARLFLRKVHLFWSGTEVDDLRVVEQIRLVDNRFTAPLWPCFALFSFAGLFGLLRAGPAREVRALAWGVMFSVASIFITTRYRLPLAPALAAFGAAGFTELARDLRTRKRLCADCIALFVALGLAIWPGGVRDVRATDHYNASVHLLAAGRAEGALEQAARGLELDAASPELRHAAGGALFKMGRYREAAESFATALKLRPTYASARYNGALSLARAGDPCSAAAVLADDPAPEPRAIALRDTVEKLCRGER